MEIYGGNLRWSPTIQYSLVGLGIWTENLDWEFGLGILGAIPSGCLQRRVS